MEIAQEKIDLIKKIIKSDKKYIDNEDLFEDFFNEACKRSFLIVKSVANESSLEAYLKKIVTTSIITVLKDEGRVRRTREGFIPEKTVSIEEIVSQPKVETFIPAGKYSDIHINYDIVDLKDGPEEIVIKKEVLQTLIDAITVSHSNTPSKQFLQLYELRYVKGLKQKEIAQELNLSQSEVSKRLLELMEEVKTAFNEA